MNHGQQVVLLLFVVSVIIGVISGLIIYHLYSNFYGGNPGLSELDYTSSFLATGIASAAFTIMLVFYPVIKKGVSSGGDDFK